MDNIAGTKDEDIFREVAFRRGKTFWRNPEQRDVIIFIVGASGSGKDTFADILEKQHGVEKVISYTTRPLRENEVEGQNHYHIPLDDFVKPDNMFAYTLFDNKHHYWTTESQILADAPFKSYIIDEKGVVFAKQTLTKPEYNNIRSVFIRIDVDKDVAISRGVSLDRIRRDESREKLHDDEYDFILSNNSDGTDVMYRYASQIINELKIK